MGLRIGSQGLEDGVDLRALFLVEAVGVLNLLGGPRQRGGQTVFQRFHGGSPLADARLTVHHAHDSRPNDVKNTRNSDNGIIPRQGESFNGKYPRCLAF